MAKKKTKEETTSVVEQPINTPVEPINVKENFTLIEKYQQGKKQNIAIRVYFDQLHENMGLENYAMSLFEGVIHEEELTCLELNGIKRYVTGLNEFAPEVKKLPTDKRNAKIREIRKAVATLEADLAANIIDPDAPDFWNHVKICVSLMLLFFLFFLSLVYLLGNYYIFIRALSGYFY